MANKEKMCNGKVNTSVFFIFLIAAFIQAIIALFAQNLPKEKGNPHVKAELISENK